MSEQQVNKLTDNAFYSPTPIDRHHPDFFALFSNEKTTAVLLANDKGATINEKDQLLEVRRGNIAVQFNSGFKLTPLVKKTVIYGCILLTRMNNKTSLEAGRDPISSVSFPIEEFADLCGERITPTVYSYMSKDAKEEEQQRAYNAKRSFKKKLDKVTSDLMGLRIVQYFGEDNDDFVKDSFVPHAELKRGIVTINFSSLFVKRLLVQPVITSVPKSIFKIDGYHATSANLAIKLMFHASMSANRKSERYQRLAVSTLQSTLNINDNTAHRKREFIDLLKTHLAYLEEIGVLREWTLVKSRGDVLTDDELERAASDVKFFSGLFVNFTIAGDLTMDEAKELASHKKKGATMVGKQPRRESKSTTTTPRRRGKHQMSDEEKRAKYDAEQRELDKQMRKLGLSNLIPTE